MVSVNTIRVSQTMTVTGVIRATGALAVLDAPVRVEAGQQIRFGLRADGVPVVSITTDTPIFDGIRLSSIQTDTVLGVCASSELPAATPPEPIAPPQRRGLGLDSHDTDHEWMLLDAAEETVEPIFGDLLRGRPAISHRRQMAWA